MIEGQKSKKLLLFASILLVAAAMRQFGSAVRTLPRTTSSSACESAVHKRLGNPRDTIFDEGANKTDYHWLGDFWLPPTGIPTYSVPEIRREFRQRNVLFIGDSTMRRAYGTIFSILNTTEIDDITVTELDSRDAIDINKGKKTDLELCTSRNFEEGTTRTEILEKEQHGLHYCRNTRDAPPGKGKFDFAAAACLCDLSRLVSHDTKDKFRLSMEYDTIITGVGIWEISRGRVCTGGRNITNPPSIDMRLDSIVANMSAWAIRQSGNQPSILWRTAGFDDSKQRFEQVHYLNEGVKHRIDLLSNTNLDYVDWGGAIWKRSVGTNRIRGDMGAHYGLQARLLFVNMLTHELRLESLGKRGNE